MNRFLTITQTTTTALAAARRCNAAMMMRMRSSSSSSRSLWILQRPSTVAAAATVFSEVPQRLVVVDHKSMDHRPRFFGNKKKNRGGGGGGGSRGGGGGGGSGGGKPKPALSVLTCYSQYEIDDGNEMELSDQEDMLTNFTQFPNLNEMKKHMAESYGLESVSELGSLEYFDDKNREWKEITNPHQQLKGLKSPVKVRSPEYFDFEDEGAVSDEDEYNIDDDEEYNPDDYGSSADDDDFGKLNLQKFTMQFVEELQAEGYSPPPEQGQIMKKSSSTDGGGGHTKIELKEWILKKAENDETLQELLLQKVGALDHMVQCLHFGFVWKPKVPKSDAIDSDDDDNDDDVAP